MMSKFRRLLLVLSMMFLFAAPAVADVWLPSGLTAIDDQAFAGSSWMSGRCAIPEGVTRIGSEAFIDCTGLSELTIPASVTAIESRAFKNCSGLTGTLTLSANVQVAADAFEGCTNLIIIVEGAEEEIDFSTLFTWTTANGEVTITDYIGDKSVTSVTVPEKIDGCPVTEIAKYAFSSSRYLTSVELPATLNTIGERAFASCTALESVSIPASVKTISKNAFYYCRALEGTLNTIDADITSNAFTGTKMIVYNYTTNTNGTLTLDRCFGSPVAVEIASSVDGRSVTAIGREAFSYSTKLQSVQLPEGITEIGANAFYYCSALKSIVLPEGVASIGSSAFRYCSSMTAVTIPGTVRSIGAMAFSNCTKLSGSVTLVDVSMDFSAFNACGNLEIFSYVSTGSSLNLDSVISDATSLTIPAQVNGMNVTGMNAMAFYDCLDLEHITLPSTFTTIGEMAFMQQESLVSITIPSSIKSIGASAFEGCTALENIIIHSGIRTVGSKAFFGCTSLTSATIQSASTVLDTLAFYNCTALADVDLPAGYRNVGNYAFTNTQWISDQMAAIAREATRGCSTQEQKARALHDWVIKNSAYDESYTYYGIEGILFHGTGVCNSYTLTYQELLTSVGITSQIVSGTATNNSGVTGSHAWNLVQLNGDWYHIDTTWDDPLPNGRETHTYYCMTDAQLAVNHTWDTASVPAANGYLYGAAANSSRIASR